MKFIKFLLEEEYFSPSLPCGETPDSYYLDTAEVSNPEVVALANEVCDKLGINFPPVERLVIGKEGDILGYNSGGFAEGVHYWKPKKEFFEEFGKLYFEKFRQGFEAKKLQVDKVEDFLNPSGNRKAKVTRCKLWKKLLPEVFKQFRGEEVRENFEYIREENPEVTQRELHYIGKRCSDLSYGFHFNFGMFEREEGIVSNEGDHYFSYLKENTPEVQKIGFILVHAKLRYFRTNFPLMGMRELFYLHPDKRFLFRVESYEYEDKEVLTFEGFSGKHKVFQISNKEEEDFISREGEGFLRYILGKGVETTEGMII